MPMTEVAERFGVSHQAVHRWIGWYRDEGVDTLAVRSSRPRTSPIRTPPEVAIGERRAESGPLSTITGNAGRGAKLLRLTGYQSPLGADGAAVLVVVVAGVGVDLVGSAAGSAGSSASGRRT